MLTKNLIVLALLSTSAALANSIIVVGTHTSLGQNIWMNETLNSTSTNFEAWSGGIDIKVDGYSRVVFCVDLFTDINVGTYNAVLGAPGTPQLQRVAWLLQNQYPTNKNNAAGFQLAIWDIIHDNGDGFTAGMVRRSTDARNPTSNTIVTTALGYETASLGKSSTKAVVYHISNSAGLSMQTLMGAWPNDGGPYDETPEPTAKVLVVSGAALIGISRVRRGFEG
jgi:hypothetical protein